MTTMTSMKIKFWSMTFQRYIIFILYTVFPRRISLGAGFAVVSRLRRLLRGSDLFPFTPSGSLSVLNLFIYCKTNPFALAEPSSATPKQRSVEHLNEVVTIEQQSHFSSLLVLLIEISSIPEYTVVRRSPVRQIREVGRPEMFRLGPNPTHIWSDRL